MICFFHAFFLSFLFPFPFVCAISSFECLETEKEKKKEREKKEREKKNVNQSQCWRSFPLILIPHSPSLNLFLDPSNHFSSLFLALMHPERSSKRSLPRQERYPCPVFLRNRDHDHSCRCLCCCWCLLIPACDQVLRVKEEDQRASFEREYRLSLKRHSVHSLIQRSQNKRLNRSLCIHRPLHPHLPPRRHPRHLVRLSFHVLLMSLRGRRTN